MGEGRRRGEWRLAGDEARCADRARTLAGDMCATARQDAECRAGDTALIPVRRAALVTAFEGTRQALHAGGDVMAPAATISTEMSKFTGELLRSAWTSHPDPDPKISGAVSEIFAIGHGHLLSLETLAQYASFRNREGELKAIRPFGGCKRESSTAPRVALCAFR